MTLWRIKGPMGEIDIQQTTAEQAACLYPTLTQWRDFPEGVEVTCGDERFQLFKCPNPNRPVMAKKVDKREPH